MVRKPLIIQHLMGINFTFMIQYTITKGARMTDVEKVRNQRAVEHAIAQQRLEGLAVPPEAMHDLQSMARGEMTLAEALHAAHIRFDHVQIRQ